MASLSLLWQPAGSVRELRVIRDRGRPLTGYFDDLTACARAALSWDGKAKGVYLTLNPVEPALLARAQNRLRDGGPATADRDVASRSWLPLDLDPSRPAEVSSSDGEHRAAIDRAIAVARWLVESGVPRAGIILADSGNGAHLLLRADAPNDEASTAAVRAFVEAVAGQHGGQGVTIDTTVYNASRIWKVYGTHACKGDSTPERPHRVARILAVGGVAWS